MIAFLCIIGYFVGMILTLTAFRCSNIIDEMEDVPTTFIIGIFWPISVLVVLIVWVSNNVLLKSVDYLVSKFCPKRK